MHLDIEVPDIDAGAEPLEQQGARRLHNDVQTEHGSRWVLMADPGGNEFCVCDGSGG